MTQQLTGQAAAELSARLSNTPSGSTVQLLVQMVCHDAATATQYMQTLQAAAAQARPDLIPVITGSDQNGNPIRVNDPAGVINRLIVEYVEKLGAAFVIQEAQAQAQAAYTAAFQSVATNVTLTTV